MPINKKEYQSLIGELGASVKLVAVSKTKSVEEILHLYQLGQRDFGENYVQELVQKAAFLPKDINWHFIGHLQTNKVKLIAPFVQLIQSVDSLKLLEEIDKQAQKAGRVIDCLLQVHIASEETKFGLDETQLDELMQAAVEKGLTNIRVKGLMGMASFTEEMEKVRTEFRRLKRMFDRYKLQTLSMGMSADFKIAIEEGSNLVRIGSKLFGLRN